MKTVIIKGLFTFLDSIYSFESAILKKYNLEGLPYNYSGIIFPRIGSIETGIKTFHYRFHGRGCFIDDGSCQLDYSINMGSINKYDTESRQFMLFLQSYMKNKEVLNLKSKDVDFLLSELKNDGLLKNSTIGDGIYELVESKIIDAYNRLV